MKKRMLYLCMIILCNFLLTGCQNIKDSESHVNDYCETVYNGFKEKQKEEIIALFCDKGKTDHDLDNELSEAFDYINGNITSYESFSEGPSGKSYRKGELVKYDQTAVIAGVSTDTGHTYRIAVNSLNVYPDDLNLVGIQRIYIREFDSENEYKEIGSFTVGEQYDTSVN